MDPITLAIVSAVAGGALSGVVAPPFSDAYTSFKTLIQTKFGHTDVPAAIESLEKKPESKSRQGTLAEEIADSGVDKDEEIRAAAAKLLEQIKAQPGGEQHNEQVAKGHNIAQAADHSTAFVNLNIPKE